MIRGLQVPGSYISFYERMGRFRLPTERGRFGNMNKKGRLLAGFLVLIILGMLGGCNKKKVTKESLLADVKTASEKQEMVTTDWTMGMDMSMTMSILTEMTIDTTIEAAGTTEMQTGTDLSHTEASMKVGVMGQDIDLDMAVYTERTDEKTVTSYVNLDDYWMKSSVELPEGEAAGATVMDMQELAEYFTLSEETVEREGVTCYEMTARIPADELLPKIAQYTTLLQTGSETDLSVFSGKTFVYQMYIAEETSLPREVLFSIGEVPEDKDETIEESAENTAEEDEGVPVTGIETEPEGEAEPDEEEAPEAEVPEAEDETGDADYEISYFSMQMKFGYPGEGTIEIPEEARDSVLIDEIPLDVADEEEEEEEAEGGKVSQFDELAAPEMIREFEADDENAVLWNENQVLVRVDKVYSEDQDLYIDLMIRNDNDFEVEFSSEGVAVNHVMTESSFYQSVKGGEEKSACIPITDFDRLEAGEPEVLSISMMASDMEQYDTFFSAESRDIFLGEEDREASPREGGEVVYEDEQLKIRAYSQENTTYAMERPLCIYNKGTRAVSLSGGTVTAGGKEINAYVYGIVLPQCILYCELSADQSELQQLGVEELSDLSFMLSANDLQTYEELYSTGEIHIP